MTSTEKALDLIHKFEHAKKYSNTTNAMSKELAKQCARIAVDEILYEFDHLAWHDDDYADYKIKYWKEVKQELEKL